MRNSIEKRIDFYPTHRHGEYRLRPGKPAPFGATLVPGGVNFSVFSSHATSCILVLFDKGTGSTRLGYCSIHTQKP